jgi:hypothetical protein
MNNEELKSFKSRIFSQNFYRNVAQCDGWGEEDFWCSVRVMEAMSREQLLTICQLPEIKLRFTAKDWEHTTPEDQIISALIADYQPEVLMQAIKEVNQD